MDYAQHVRELAAAFGVLLKELPGMPPEMALAGMLARDREKPMHERQSLVIISPVHEETTYAVALHELGHCLHPLGRVHWAEGTTRYLTTGRPSSLRDVRLLLLAEQSAWEWAHQYALEWTPPMTSVERFGLNAYAQLARQYGIKGGTS